MAYDWRQDSYQSWLLALRWCAIRCGSIRPARPLELYWAEAAGVIP